MRKVFFALPFFVLSSGAAFAEDVIVSHFEVLKQCAKISFLAKTIKEAKTPEGKALLNVAGSLVGIDPSVVSIGIMAIPIEGAGQEQDTHPFIRSPQGFTICSAKPSNLNMGSGENGIETHGDTTFNSTIVRDLNTNGLSMYMVVPCKASTDTRVQSGFDVTFVKADAGWETKYPQCSKVRSHPWLARNNHTSLNVGN
jgi:hypothetical protein